MSPNINQAGSNTSWRTGPKTYWHSQVTWLHLSRNFPIKQLICWKRHCFDNTKIAWKKTYTFGVLFFFHLLSSQLGNLLKIYWEVLICLHGCLSKQSWTFSFGLKLLFKEIINLKTYIMNLKIKKRVSSITKWFLVYFFVVCWAEYCFDFFFPMFVGFGCFAVGGGGLGVFFVHFGMRKRCYPHQNGYVRGTVSDAVTDKCSSPGCHDEPQWSSLLCWTVRGSGCSCHVTSSTLTIFY